MFRTQTLGSSLLLSIALAGCGDDPITPPPAPEFRSAVAQANPNNTISAVLWVTALGYDSAFVRFWRAGQMATATPAYAFATGDSILRIPVLGLDTAAAYSLETSLLSGGQIAFVSDTATFTTGSLPAWIPPAVAMGTDTTPGFLALSYPDGPVIIDNTGKVVWYKHFPNGTLNSFQAHANGRYSILGLNDPTPVFHILDELGEEIGTLDCMGGLKTRFHDFMILENGDSWILCDEFRTMDLSGVGGLDSVEVFATVVQHVSAGGQLLFEWNAFDHFQITDLPLADRTSAAVNFTHGNGIAFDTDGNLLLSFRSLNEITKVDVGTGQVLWRMGGLANQFTLLNDPKGTFEMQHGVRPAGADQIQLLDNGLVAPSRLVRYRLDPTAKTATLVMEFIDNPATWTRVGGSSQYYPNGHGVVSFGRAGRVVEVDGSGNPAWELTGIDGVYVFRVQRISSLYSPGLGEASR
jgi:hypothetical protein